MDVKEFNEDNMVDLFDLEEERTKEIVPVVNEGFKKCFLEDLHFVLFIDESFKIPGESEVLLIDDERNIVGKHLSNSEDIEKYCDESLYEFLSDDFVLFKKKLKGNAPFLNGEYFVLPGGEYNDLLQFREISKAYISEPSTNSDSYIKKHYKFNLDSNISTAIISFSFKK
ncbi:MAG: hypothetical protein KO202_02015 [Methanobacteriaceae archaeon]|jgi:hypothetical protein|nr:hypothetical protein [Methanobacteriaceae archaeon]